jgi:Flp pilus assembly protein CpaB
VVRYPKELLPDQAMVQESEVLGRVSIGRHSGARRRCLSRQLAGLGAQPGLSGVTPAGMRAVSVRVDEASSVGGFVSPGTYVDVIAIITAAARRRAPGVEGHSAEGSRAGRRSADEATAAEGKPALVNTVTLEVTPAQAEKLKLAEAEGRLQLSIRNATDLVIETTPGATRPGCSERCRAGAAGGGGDTRWRRSRLGRLPMSRLRCLPLVDHQYRWLAPAAGGLRPRPAAAKKSAPTGAGTPTIELIEGAKRSRVDDGSVTSSTRPRQMASIYDRFWPLVGQ